MREVEKGALAARDQLDALAVVLGAFVERMKNRDAETKEAVRRAIGPHLRLVHDVTGIALDVIGEERPL